MTRIIAITSGKGGVGKTNLSANLAVQLALQGHRTCVFDADLGLANINILFGLYPEKTIEDTVTKAVPLEKIIIKNQYGIDIIPGSSGVEHIANCEPPQLEQLIASFAALPAYDFLFFDTSAGVSRTVVSFCLAASEIVLVITPEPTSLTDAYALLKILCANGLKHPVRVVVNHCKDAPTAKQTYARFRDVTKKYLPVDLHPLGFIVEDPKISFAVNRQKPFINLFPDTLASKCIKAIANNLLQSSPDVFIPPRGVESFWKQFVQIWSGSLALLSDQADKKKTQPEPQLQPSQEEQPSAATAVPKPEVHPAPGAPPVEPPTPVPLPSEAPPVQPAATPPATLPADNMLSSVLQTLTTSIATIADEVKLLRKALETSSKASSMPIASPTNTEDVQKPKGEPIILDFETYLLQHSEKQ